MKVRVGQIVPVTEAEGPGRQYALWFQGCPLRCPGCCNPQMLPFEGGDEREVDDLIAEIHDHGVEGISLLGGEPFAHLPAATLIAKATQAMGKSVMVYSGYTLDEARQLPGGADLLTHIDVLVDGPYLRELPESKRRWVGSSNQVVHFLSDFYSPLDPCWAQRNTLELRLVNGELTVNGFPAPSAVGLWKRPGAPA